MGLFEGKKGLIVGVANDRSIAWAIAKKVMEEGGECGFTHLPDRPDDERKKNHRRVSKCTEQFPDAAKFLVPLDVCNDDHIAEVITKVTRTRHEDLSGLKEYRVSTKTHAWITVRLSYGKEWDLSEPYIYYGGEKAVLRQVAEGFKGDWWLMQAQFDLERATRVAGADEYQRFNAIYSGDGRRDACLALMRLLEQLEREVQPC